MEYSFESLARDVAKNYLNSILFVDERAYNHTNEINKEDSQKDLDLLAITRAFSDTGISCCFFAPESYDDIERCKQLVLKPDIVVLDWDIRLANHATKEEENQDDETDFSGYSTKQLINTIVEDAADEKLKVLFVYTGEINLSSIIKDIVTSLNNARFKVDDGNYEIHSDNIHIFVRLKPGLKLEYVNLQQFVVQYDSLPDTLINSFSSIVQGLMPCFAMSSLTAIRECSAKILRVFNNKLDPEFLGHQMALPDPEDAKDYIATAFGSGITELIIDSPSTNTDQWVIPWVKNRFKDRTLNKQFAGKTYTISDTTLEKFINSKATCSDLEARIKDAFNISFDKKKKREEERDIIRNLSSFFTGSEPTTISSKHSFATLATHKNFFSLKKNSYPLTLGTILIREDSNDYLLCIQQGCDTARVPEKGMKYMFLPLLEKKTGQALIAALTSSNEKTLYLVKSSKNCELIHFTPQIKGGPVYSKEKDGKQVFFSGADVYIWAGQLKELFAQRIVSAFTSHFARVAVNEAEWLRIEEMSED